MMNEQKLREDSEDASNEAENGTEASGEQSGLDRLADLEKELEEVRQHALYAQAETQNVRRRLEQEKQLASTYAATAFARDMLSVKDNLDRALASIPEDLREDDKIKAILTGIEATARELDNVFQRNGISRIEALGQSLDPNKHQAMVEVPSDEAEPGTIVEEMQSGYMIKERLLRPALVAVARKP